MTTLRPIQLSSLLCLAVAGCIIESPVDPGPDDGGSDTSSGGALQDTGSETDPGDDGATDDGATDDGETDGCETDGCEADEGYECLTSLAWNGELLATANRSAPCPDCGEHGASQGVLLTVDPTTGERTELGFADVKQTFEMLAVAPDGGLVVGGAVFVPETLSETPLLQRYTPEGALSWTAPLTLDVVDLALRDEQVLVVSGHSLADLTVVSGADGSIVEELSGGLGRTQAVAVDDDGSVYVAGDAAEVVDGSVLSEDSFVRKYDVDLQLLWEQVEPAADVDDRFTAQGLVVDEDGGVVAAFRQSAEDSADSTIVFRKYDAAGVLQWETSFEGTAPEADSGIHVHGLRARPGGGVIAIGQAAALGEVSAFTLAYDGAGVLLWSDLQAHPELSQEINEGVVIASDAVFVAGCGRGEPDDQAWLLEFEP